MSLGEAMNDLNDVVHSPVRFAIMAGLASVDDATYQVLKEELGVSYALLTKHATILEDHGYLEIHKSFLAKKPQTVFRLTRLGRNAFADHVAALRRLQIGFR